MKKFEIHYLEGEDKVTISLVDEKVERVLDLNDEEQCNIYKKILFSDDSIYTGEYIDIFTDPTNDKSKAPGLTEEEIEELSKVSLKDDQKDIADAESKKSKPKKEKVKKAKVKKAKVKKDKPKKKKAKSKKRFKFSKGLKIATAAAAIGVIGGGAYALSRKAKTQTVKIDNENRSNSNSNVQNTPITNEQTATSRSNAFESLTMENWTSLIDEKFANNATAHDFYTKLINTLQALNIAASSEGFVLEKDKETLSVLRFNHEEVLSAMIALNDYSDQELFEIFGDNVLSAETISENYKSFINKLSVYYMNGVNKTGISNLIRNDANRRLFNRFEDTLIEFNQNPNHSSADKLIRYFEYYVVQSSNKSVYRADLDKINAFTEEEFNAFVNAKDKDDLKLDATVAPYVKHLIINMVHGYMNANSQAEYKTYRTVSTSPSYFDRLFTSDKYAQVQKGQTLDEYFTREKEDSISIIETAGCETEKVDKHIADSIEGFSKKRELSRQTLSKRFLDAGLSAFSDMVLDGISSDEFAKIYADASATKVYDDYTKEISVDLNYISFLVAGGFDELDSKVFEYGHSIIDPSMEGELREDIVALFNNRVRGLEKIIAAPSNSYETKTEVETVKTETKTVEVSEEDLTPQEKEEVKNQEEQVKEDTYQVTIGEKTFDQGKASYAAKEGWNDATSYAVNETGSYSHANIINNVNPNYPSVVPVNGTLYDIAVNAYAFEGEVITTSDSQIQARLASDLERFANKDYSQYYKEGWLAGMEQILSSAVSEGVIVRSEAERLYQEALKAVEEQNNRTKEATVSEETEKAVEELVTDNSNTEKIEETDTKSNEHTPVETVDGIDIYDVDDIMNPTILDSIEGVDDVYDENFDGTYAGLTEEEILSELTEINESESYVGLTEDEARIEREEVSKVLSFK